MKEAADSLKWRRFCHPPPLGKVPEDKTLIKLTGRYGEGPVRTIFETVVRRALEAKVIRGRKMRLDTTVMETDIHFPTDTGVLADGVRVVSRTVRGNRSTASWLAWGLIAQNLLLLSRLGP